MDKKKSKKTKIQEKNLEKAAGGVLLKTTTTYPTKTRTF